MVYKNHCCLLLKNTYNRTAKCQKCYDKPSFFNFSSNHCLLNYLFIHYLYKDCEFIRDSQLTTLIMSKSLQMVIDAHLIFNSIVYE